MKKAIPLSDKIYWQLREIRDDMSKEENRAVTFDDVIQRLIHDHEHLEDVA